MRWQGTGKILLVFLIPNILFHYYFSAFSCFRITIKEMSNKNILYKFKYFVAHCYQKQKLNQSCHVIPSRIAINSLMSSVYISEFPNMCANISSISSIHFKVKQICQKLIQFCWCNIMSFNWKFFSLFCNLSTHWLILVIV